MAISSTGIFSFWATLSRNAPVPAAQTPLILEFHIVITSYSIHYTKLYDSLLPPEGFTVTLNCIRKLTSGSGKNRSTHETILAQEETLIPLQMLRRGVGGTIIPLQLRNNFV